MSSYHKKKGQKSSLQVQQCKKINETASFASRSDAHHRFLTIANHTTPTLAKVWITYRQLVDIVFCVEVAGEQGGGGEGAPAALPRAGVQVDQPLMLSPLLLPEDFRATPGARVGCEGRAYFSFTLGFVDHGPTNYKQCCGSGRIRNFWPDPDPIRNRN
jgi:hypothetical protein